MRWIGVSLWAALAVAPVSSSHAATFGLPGADHVVYGATKGEMETRGIPIIDDYDYFVTARLTESQVTALRNERYLPLPVDHRTGRGGYFGNLKNGSPAIPSALRAPGDSPYAIVQFRGPVKKEWLLDLEATGSVLYDYLPHHAYLVKLTAEGRYRLPLLAGFWHVEPYHPAFKISSGMPSTGTLSLLVSAFPEASRDGLLHDLQALGAHPGISFTTSKEHVVQVTADAGSVSSIAQLASVTWIEPAPTEVEFDNNVSSAMTQSGTTTAYPVHARGVDGSTQILGTCDMGIITEPVDPADPVLALSDPFRVLRPQHEVHGEGPLQLNADRAPDRIDLPRHPKIELFYAPEIAPGSFAGDGDDTGHGTHTSGTLAGNKPDLLQRNLYDGVAYGARLVLCDISLPNAAVQFHPDPRVYFERMYQAGAKISSNSWGPGLGVGAPAYTLVSRAIDEYVEERPDFLFAFAAGNNNCVLSLDCDTPHRYNPLALGKNVLAVGATTRGGDRVDVYSSRGGPLDGRIKPEVLALGTVVSAGSQNGTSYTELSGTSMSTPAVAGAAGLLRDYFAKGLYKSANPVADPSAALLRALLLVSSVEIPNDDGDPAYPNTVQGWGRPVLDDVLEFEGDTRRLLLLDTGETPSLSTGSPAWERRVRVRGGEPFRVMIAWTDPPAAPSSIKVLVNDLDLVVKGPDGTVYRGNQFAGGLAAANPPARDGRNVNEGVFLRPPAGTDEVFTLRVEAAEARDQSFAIAVTGSVSWVD